MNAWSMLEGQVERAPCAGKSCRLFCKRVETRNATQTLELKGPLELVFHDSDQTPPGVQNAGTIGVVFRTPAAPKEPEPEGEVVAPTP